MSKTIAETLKKPSTLEEQVESICTASYLAAVNRIKTIVANKDGYGPDQVRLILETAQAREVRAKTQRPAVRQALRNALKKLPADSIPTPPSKSVTAEVITPKQAVLTDASKALEKLRGIIVKHEETFAATTLGPRLQIGLQCLKAHHVFTIKDPKKTGAMKGKKAVTRDGLPTEGFEGWLAAECQWLKKPTAYKYMTAVRGLGFDHDATEKQVAAALKLRQRKETITLAALCAAALEPFGPPPPEPPRIEQQEFEFLKQGLSAFREECDALIAAKAQLDAYPDFKRVATARLYAALHDLTGTHWKPSDEPDALALIDPDSINI